MIQLRPYQREGIEFFKKNKYAILGDEAGLGKTVQSLFAFRELKLRKTLIIVPANIREQWEEQYHLHLGESLYVVTGFSDTLPKDKSILCSYHSVSGDTDVFKQLKDLTFDLVIIDEFHYLKELESLRTKAILGVNGILYGKHEGFIWCMSGTPLLNRPLEFYPILSTLFKKYITPYDTYGLYTQRYCAGHFDKDTQKYDARGASNLEELYEKIRPIYLRRLKKDHLKDLPGAMVKSVKLCIDEKVHQVYQEIEDRLKAGERVGGKYGETNVLLHKLAEAKVHQYYFWVIGFLKETKEKIIITYYHDTTRDELLRILSDYNPLVVSGKMKRSKQAVIKDFKETNSRILLLQFVAGGTGIDGLQHVSNNIHLLEWGWSPSVLDQIISRLDRLGQTEPVYATIFYLPGTVEEVTLRVIQSKERNINKVIKPREEKIMTIEAQLDSINQNLLTLIGLVKGDTTLVSNGADVSPEAETPAPPPAKPKAKKRRGSSKKNEDVPVKEDEPKPMQAESNNTVIEMRETLRQTIQEYLAKCWPSDKRGQDEGYDKACDLVETFDGATQIDQIPNDLLQTAIDTFRDLIDSTLASEANKRRMAL